MRTLCLKALIVSLAMLSISCSTVGINAQYHNAVREARLGNASFAFMELRDYLQKYPDSPYTPAIRFAIGEYYFQVKDYHHAIRELTDYITRYPQEKNAVFAEAILYKIFLAHPENQETLEKLRELFFSKSILLVFSEAKTKQYRSILNNHYRIAEYVDRLEVFRNGELLFEVKF